jgi:hypothetical protein
VEIGRLMKRGIMPAKARARDMSHDEFYLMPSVCSPALRIALAWARRNREAVAAFPAFPGAYRFNAPTCAGVILPDQHGNIFAGVVGFLTGSARGAVSRQHFPFLLIQHHFNFLLTGGCLPGTLRGFALC